MLVKSENSIETVPEKEECLSPESVVLRAEEKSIEQTEIFDSYTKQSLYKNFY